MNSTTKTKQPFYKKKAFIIIATLLLLALLGKIFGSGGDAQEQNNDDRQTETVDKSSIENNNAKALEAIKTEPKVAEALITNANVLYVSVKDDGTRRDGYAEYLCQVLREYGSNVNRVKVTEVGTTKSPDRDNAYGILLGEAYCN